MYDEAVQELRDVCELAYEDFTKVGVHLFCKAFISEHSRCPVVINNISESFNNTLKQFRDKPIIDLLEGLRQQIMLRNYERKDKLSKCTDKVCPNIKKDMQKMMPFVRTLRVFKASEASFEVCDGDQRFVVLLNIRTCDCRGWQLSGVPCRHALACIHFNRNDPLDYVDDWHSIQRALKSYAQSMVPLSGEKMWPKNPNDKLAPPKVRRMPGRPKKNRRKDVNESSSSLRVNMRAQIHKCALCNMEGHNKRGCPLRFNPPEKPPKEQVIALLL